MKPKKTGPLFTLFLLLLIGGLMFLLQTGQTYYETATQAIESTAGAATLDKEDVAKLAAAPAEKLDTEIKFRNFFLTAPNAKKVELQADFNQWGKVPLLLKPYARGYFEISVALAAGEYKYVFVVDGKEVLDPSNLDRVEENGHTVCIKTVK